VLVNTIGAFRPETRSPAAIGLGLVIAPSISTALYEGRTYQPCLYLSLGFALVSDLDRSLCHVGGMDRLRFTHIRNIYAKLQAQDCFSAVRRA
jgi:hypothetical protein